VTKLNLAFLLCASLSSFAFSNEIDARDKSNLSKRIEEGRTKNLIRLNKILKRFELKIKDKNGDFSVASAAPLLEESLPRMGTEGYEEHARFINARVGGMVEAFFVAIESKLSQFHEEDELLRIELIKTSTLGYLFETLEPPLCRNDSDCLAVNIGMPCSRYTVVSLPMYGLALNSMSSGYRARLGGFYDKVWILTKIKPVMSSSCPKNVRVPRPRCVQNSCTL